MHPVRFSFIVFPMPLLEFSQPCHQLELSFLILLATRRWVFLGSAPDGKKCKMRRCQGLRAEFSHSRKTGGFWPWKQPCLGRIWRQPIARWCGDVCGGQAALGIGDGAAPLPGAPTQVLQGPQLLTVPGTGGRGSQEEQRKHRLNNQEKKINCSEWQLAFRDQAV